MDIRQIEQFLHIIGGQQIKRRGIGWMGSTCPLAPWRHAGGRDTHPSFGIRIAPGRISRCSCFACHYEEVKSGDLLYLLWYLSARTGRDLEPAAALLAQYNQPGSTDDEEPDETPIALLQKKILKSTYSFGSPPPKELILTPQEIPETFLPEEHLSGLKELPAAATSYLVSTQRQLTLATAAEWELGWHPAAKRIVIPIRDRVGRLVGLSGRSTTGADPKYLHSAGYARDHHLYGEHKIVEGGLGILTEGFFDVQWLWQWGYRYPIALLGTHLSKWQADKIVQYFNRLIIFLDGDLAGIEAADKASRTLHGRIPLEVVHGFDGKDPNEHTPEQLFDLLGAPLFPVEIGLTHL